MTVGELIAKLRTFPPDYPVHITYEGISAEVSKVGCGPINEPQGDMTQAVFLDAGT